MTGEKIRVERTKKGYNQEYMAFMLDISQNAYSKIERNETDVTVKRLYAIARVLDISPLELLPMPIASANIDTSFLATIFRKVRRFFKRTRKS